MGGANKSPHPVLKRYTGTWGDKMMPQRWTATYSVSPYRLRAFAHFAQGPANVAKRIIAAAPPILLTTVPFYLLFQWAKKANAHSHRK